ncbi:cadherin EGF LAG seven-pass G-type receptor 1-like [Saccostrea echinata]|uniref:cadherin EGF LAG seven-pass G-type receptor 1-like n=1 Tax=Saccostrea echinata TaxID=191078 RepID=UPI002A830FB2|nr:cadherin EGF LAG seven-pass G-type receptor 1-like [Saccostrea echinata]
MGIFSTKQDTILWEIAVILLHGDFLQNVRATDFDTAQLRLNVHDTNEHTPQFIGTPYRVEVLENIPIRSSVFQVSAVDGDRRENGRLRYVLLQGTQNFEIDDVSGVIKTRANLDREIADRALLMVEVHDHGTPPKSTTVMVSVHILDENDNAPVFSRDRFISAVSDGVSIGQVVMQINAVDADAGKNAKLSYRFVHSNNPSCHDFSIDPLSGVIRVAQKLNDERASHIPACNVKVVATDGGVPTLSSTAEITIEIVSLNDII